MQRGKRRAFVERNGQFHARAHGRHAAGNLFAQPVEAFARLGRNIHGPGRVDGFAKIDRVDLVERLHTGLVARAQLAQHAQHGRALVRHVRRGKIVYQHQQIGVERFFQRGVKRFHQLVGQFVDKAHRIHEQARAVFRQFHLAENRVERGEKLILHIGVRAGKRVE